jgi:hypothetical protein
MKKIILLILTCTLTLTACNKASKNNPHVYRSLFDKTGVKDRSDLSSWPLTFLAKGDHVLFLGDKSNETVKITLGGKEYNDHMLLIELMSGEKGWIHSAALMRDNETTPEAAREAWSEKTLNRLRRLWRKCTSSGLFPMAPDR